MNISGVYYRAMTSWKSIGFDCFSAEVNCSVCGNAADVDDNHHHGCLFWCKECDTRALRCSICELSVHSLGYYCVSCGHGGHSNHLKEWFQSSSHCPTGCGCRCNDLGLLEEDGCEEFDFFDSNEFENCIEPLYESGSESESDSLSRTGSEDSKSRKSLTYSSDEDLDSENESESESYSSSNSRQKNNDEIRQDKEEIETEEDEGEEEEEDDEEEEDLEHEQESDTSDEYEDMEA